MQVYSPSNCFSISRNLDVAFPISGCGSWNNSLCWYLLCLVQKNIFFFNLWPKSLELRLSDLWVLCPLDAPYKYSLQDKVSVEVKLYIHDCLKVSIFQQTPDSAVPQCGRCQVSSWLFRVFLDSKAKTRLLILSLKNEHICGCVKVRAPLKDSPLL